MAHTQRYPVRMRHLHRSLLGACSPLRHPKRFPGRWLYSTAQGFYFFSLGQGWEFTPHVSGNTGTSVSKAGSGVLKEACSGRRGKRTSQRGGVGTLARRPGGRTPALRLWGVRPSLRYELDWGAVGPASQIQEVEFLTSGLELGALKPQPVTQGALSSTIHGWHH